MQTDSTLPTVRLPIRWKDGAIALADGRPIPKIDDDTVGDLVIPLHCLGDRQDRLEWTSEREVLLLPKGTSLWARVKVDSIQKDLVPFRKQKSEWLNVPLTAVGFVLLEALNLKIRAGKKSVLTGAQCEIPALALEAASVNEACSKISEAFEPSRRSHTGSVFLCVFYEFEGALRPLEHRRGIVETSASVAKE